MSAFALGSDDRLDRSQHRSTGPRTDSLARSGSRCRLRSRWASWMVAAAGARGRPHEQRARSRRADPARRDGLPAGGAARDFGRARRFRAALLGRSRRIPPARRRDRSTLSALATAAVFAAWHPVHAWLFGGYVHYAGAELSPAAYPAARRHARPRRRPAGRRRPRAASSGAATARRAGRAASHAA